MPSFPQTDATKRWHPFQRHPIPAKNRYIRDTGLQAPINARDVSHKPDTNIQTQHHHGQRKENQTGHQPLSEREETMGFHRRRTGRHVSERTWESLLAKYGRRHCLGRRSEGNETGVISFTLAKKLAFWLLLKPFHHKG